ncbi:hypothetical protein ACFL96_04980 [Thermoproteota archaeon]
MMSPTPKINDKRDVTYTKVSTLSGFVLNLKIMLTVTAVIVIRPIATSMSEKVISPLGSSLVFGINNRYGGADGS